MRRTSLVVTLGAAATLVLATTAQAVTVTTGGTDGTDDKVSDHSLCAS